MSISFRDISDQILKLTKIAWNFGRFLPYQIHWPWTCLLLYTKLCASYWIFASPKFCFGGHPNFGTTFKALSISCHLAKLDGWGSSKILGIIAKKQLPPK